MLNKILFNFIFEKVTLENHSCNIVWQISTSTKINANKSTLTEINVEKNQH